MATLIDTTVSIDFAAVARDLKLSPDQVERTVDLLDDGNTVPFVTRYRKDQTGGLDEEQIRFIHEQVGKSRMLAERKTTILKSIESQGKLTRELAAQIKAAPTTKRLEDLYLPFKPKKQSLATLARQRGLEPLAEEIFEGQVAPDDLAERATHFVRVDKQLNGIDEVIQGVGHLLSERFSERPDLRGKLRKLFWRQGKIVSNRVGGVVPEGPPRKADTSPSAGSADPSMHDHPAATAEPIRLAPPEAETKPAIDRSADSVSVPVVAADLATHDSPPAAPVNDAHDDAVEPAREVSVAEQRQTESAAEADSGIVSDQPDGASIDGRDPSKSNEETSNPTTSQPKPSTARRAAKKKKEKDKKRDKQEKAFKDYFDFSESVSRIPPHRILAINRGERARILRVKIELDNELLEREAAELVLPADHPHGEFLKQCLRDALARLVLPSLEREFRRELTEKAESHAVDVFAKNLRSLLLQPPVRHCRPLAVDPGFRNGCKYSALDGFGNVLDHGVAYIVGNQNRIQQGRDKLAEVIKTHHLNVIAIGNGTGCRETEQLVADLLANELKDEDVSYVIVNEAGASVYSTSPLGREELPNYDAVLRGAISIGRRLLDPLSELVKINPANIGVGMYQHDVRAKHLQESLDSVVESCVNFVGVDVNTASPALLRYVSGLNQLTARRLFEYRQEHGPFKNREQLKEVAGFGEATFVQSAGFLKINDGDNSLDATWIHPESYDVARRVLEKLDSSIDDLPRPPVPSPALTGDAEPQVSVAPTVEAVAKAPADDQPAAEAVSPPDGDAAGGLGSTAGGEDSVSNTTPLETQANAAKKALQLAERAAKLDVKSTAADLNIGEMLLRDILGDLQRPGRDPREDLPKPIFRRGILKLEDLTPDMELTGTVLNVVDFGAFVDIGLHDTGLVHISRLANQFVKDPHEVVSVGDVLTVWVHEIDKERRRVSLTAVKPGTEQTRGDRRQAASTDKPRPPRRRDKARHKKKPAAAVGGRDSRRTKSAKHAGSQQKKKPKPVTPITDAMAEGSEPMRSFSDLVQFFDKASQSGKKNKDADTK